VCVVPNPRRYERCLARLGSPLPLTASCGGFSVDHGQKHELGDVTIKGMFAINGPTAEGCVPKHGLLHASLH
jgi:hypothetical protein